MKKILCIFIFNVLIFSLYAQDSLIKEQQWAAIANAPYYALYGYASRIGDLEIYSPYIGLGLQSTKFSIGYYLHTGMHLYYKKFSWKVEYLQGIIPDLAFFDYKNLEYYGQNTFIYDFNSVRVSSLTRMGKILYGFHSTDEAQLKGNVFTDFGIQQNFALDVQFFNDEFIILTSTFSLGFDFIPDHHQSAIFYKMVTPLTLDFVHSKLGFMTTIFYTAYLSQQRDVIIGKRYFGYDAAIDLLPLKTGDLYNNFYHFTGTFDMIYRIYFRGLPSPSDRFYFAVGANVGFGQHLQGKKFDLLYMGTVALGYELYDAIPFELRFSIDQNRNIFLNLNVVSPISHRADSRPK
ncbi:MAG: hypothetical protein ACRCVN_02930 [Spirochaetia bacterium]